MVVIDSEDDEPDAAIEVSDSEDGADEDYSEGDGSPRGAAIDKASTVGLVATDEERAAILASEE